MHEIEDIPLETVEGERPRSPFADRLILGLAATAILGGLMVAAGNLVGGLLPEEIAKSTATPEASPRETPRPTRTARPSPTPRPLRELTLVPGTPPEPPDWGIAQSPEWMEAVGEIILYDRPSVDAEELRRLAIGEVVVAQPSVTRDGWVQVVEPLPGGYASVVGADGSPLANFYPMDEPSYQSGVEQLTSGLGGFSAIVWEQRGLREQPRISAVFSSDGERWEPMHGPDYSGFWGGWAAADGPSGWLAATYGDGGLGGAGSPWIWEAADGRRWTPVGRLETTINGGPLRLAASELGYLLWLSPSDERSSGIWFSDDGILWQEAESPFPRPTAGREYPGEMELAASAAGFAVWFGNEYGDLDGPAVAFSPDGRNWRQVSVPADITHLELGLEEDTLLGIGRTALGATVALRATLAEGVEPALERVPELDVPFRDAVVTAIASDGERMVAVGYEPGTERSLVWTSEHQAWSRTPAPASGFGGIARQVAIGPVGIVVVGYDVSPLGQTPVLWHRRADGSWRTEASRLVEPIPEPTEAQCGELPSTAVAFLALGQVRGPVCFGNEEMTFRAFSIPCDWCVDDPLPGADPWMRLQGPSLLLSPMESDGGWWSEAILSHDLAEADVPRGAWVEVTGHYADPAAEDCGAPPPPETNWYYAGRDIAIWQCRQRFVVTRIGPIETATS